MGRLFLVIAVLLGAATAGADQNVHGRLFPPENLGLLEGPDRDDWQQPDRVMDALGIADGAHVGDLGAGGGWFTVRLARRVGPNGRVYAEDIQPQMLESIRRRVRREGLANVETVLGTPTDPMLPPGLAAVLIVDVYPQMADPVAVLGHIRESLAPGGRLGIIDFKTDGAGGPGPPLDNRLHHDVIIEAAGRAGLRLLRHETFLRFQYLLVFEADTRVR
ncbi:MAG TPA: methyltransferase domain-containing protein [Vicinamibacterales bacterium]|nr:methyltransferase domain-containing protein [Vicinamibacterales bacterium]